MDIFDTLISALGTLPVWVLAILFPSMLALAAVLFTVFGGRKFYPAVAGAVIAGSFAVAAARSMEFALVYGGILAAAACLLSALFLIPVPRKREKKTREERVYERFKPEEAPPKVCCFGEPVQPEESGMRLEYVDGLISKLERCALSPADRLELSALSRSVDACRGKPLDADDLGRLNDCLSVVLRLTARYKL